MYYSRWVLPLICCYFASLWPCKILIWWLLISLQYSILKIPFFFYKCRLYSCVTSQIFKIIFLRIAYLWCLSYFSLNSMRSIKCRKNVILGHFWSALVAKIWTSNFSNFCQFVYFFKLSKSTEWVICTPICTIISRFDRTIISTSQLTLHRGYHFENCSRW